MELSRNGLRISYEQRGTGPHVTLVHGVVMNSKVWRHQVEPLARTHRVLTYDLRGHGESGKPANGVLSYEAHVEDLLALLDHLGIQQTVLVGWSMGASIATVFAARHPGRVSRLVLLSATPMLIARPDFPYAMPPEQQAALIAAAEQDFSGLLKGMVGLMMPEPHEPSLDASLHGMGMQAGKDVFIASMRQTAPIDLRPVIADLQVPTLLLHGELDRLCLVPAGQYFAEHIRGAAFRLFEGAGHVLLLTRAEAVNAALAEFLAG